VKKERNNRRNTISENRNEAAIIGGVMAEESEMAASWRNQIFGAINGAA